MTHVYGRVDQKFETAMLFGGLTPAARKRARVRARDAAKEARRVILERVAKERAQQIEHDRRQALQLLQDIAAVRSIPAAVVDIIIEMANVYEVPAHLLVASKPRSRVIAPARFAAIYTIRASNPNRSFETIGRWFGTDHTSVLYAAKRHAQINDLPQVTGMSRNTLERRKRAA